MHNYPYNDVFLHHNIKLYKMIDMHSKYDNVNTNRIFNALNCINNHVNSCTNFMVSPYTKKKLYALLVQVKENLRYIRS